MMVDDTGNCVSSRQGLVWMRSFSLCSIQRPLVQVSWLAKLAGWHIYFLNKEFLIHIGQIDIFFK